ncbi:MAG: hypothetical protein U0263_05275 [Polyangiaceae bacterium]
MWRKLAWALPVLATSCGSSGSGGGAGGGSNTGGTASGGASGSGGTATGGASGSGGTATGGASGSGGSATGGASGSGGASGAGGTAAGGASGAGGTSVGGASGSGGTMTGGTGGTGGSGICVPGSQHPCYTGPAAAQGVGSCVKGVEVCNAAGTGYGACSGDVLPGTQTCTLPALDDDCNGTANENCCTAGAWTKEVVESAGDVGTENSIAVDLKGGVHIAYYDATVPSPGNAVSDLRYAYRPRGGVFSTSAIHTQSSFGIGTSIATDAGGGVHVSYYQAAGASLWYAHKPAGGVWATSQVLSVSAATPKSAIAVDGLGNVHIAFKANDQVRHAKLPAGASTWTFQTIANSKGGNLALVLDSAALGHVVATSYGITSFAALTYGRMNLDGSWSVTAVGYSQSGVGLDVDAKDMLHIAYGNEASPYLRYGTKAAGTTSWTGENCWGPGLCTPATGDLDIGVDAKGVAHVLYYDGALRYARRIGSASWKLEVVDGASDAGSHLSEALDTGGGVHVAYYDATSKDLKYAYRCP